MLLVLPRSGDFWIFSSELLLSELLLSEQSGS